MEYTPDEIGEMLTELGFEVHRVGSAQFMLKVKTTVYVDLAEGVQSAVILVAVADETLHVIAPNCFDLSNPPCGVEASAGLSALLAGSMSYLSHFELCKKQQRVILRHSVDLTTGIECGFPEALNGMIWGLVRHLDAVYEPISTALLTGHHGSPRTARELADRVSSNQIRTHLRKRGFAV